MKDVSLYCDEVASGGRGVAPTGGGDFITIRVPAFVQIHPKGETFMAKHLNPFEKEFLIRQFKTSRRTTKEFCAMNNITEPTLKRWVKQYEEGGLEGLARADADIRSIVPEGFDRTEESYKREILKLRIENERLKKSYAVQMNSDGQTEYVRLKEKSLK